MIAPPCFPEEPIDHGALRLCMALGTGRQRGDSHHVRTRRLGRISGIAGIPALRPGRRRAGVLAGDCTRRLVEARKEPLARDIEEGELADDGSLAECHVLYAAKQRQNSQTGAR